MLLNSATNKVHKFVDHKYIYYLNSATCFGLVAMFGNIIGTPQEYKSLEDRTTVLE